MQFTISRVNIYIAYYNIHKSSILLVYKTFLAGTWLENRILYYYTAEQF